MKLLIFGLFLSLCANAEEKQFSFYEFFNGEWDVQRSTAYFKSSAQNFEELPGHYSIQKENGTVHLIGRYYENDTSTGELTNEMAVSVDFETSNSGTFKTGQTEYDLSALFHFDFVTQLNGMILSHGEWHGTNGGFYQFNVGSWDRFSITIWEKEKDDKAADPAVVILVGKRIVNTEKTFFQKYGMYALLGGVLILNMFLQSKTRSMQASRPAAARPAGSTEGAAATESPGKKKTK